MLLAIDIGNSAVKFGLYNGQKLLSRFSIPTVRTNNAAEIFSQIKGNLTEKFSAIVISSVVPETNPAFRRLAEDFYNLEPVFVENHFDFGLKIKYNPPESVGVDRLIAAFAAVEKYGKPCVVCDFGTATTIDAVNSNGEYLGGTIAAGMNLLADALFQRTSKLPRIEIEKPEKVIGDSTARSIQSGIYFGYVGLADGIINRITNELGEPPRVIATGGFAGIIAESSERIQTVDANLMLEGLRLIYENAFNEKDNPEFAFWNFRKRFVYTFVNCFRSYPMKKHILFSLLILCLSVSQIEAQRKSAEKIAPPKNYQPIALKSSPSLQTLLEKAVNETLSEYAAKKVSANDIAATLIDLRDANDFLSASVRGDQKIYPASVVKLFYLTAAEQWLEDGKMKSTPELERGLRNMIVDSSNDATNYIVDVLTDTGSGGELSAKELKIFGEKRNAVNRYFTSLGFTDINTNQKTYYEDAYGRERQFRFDGANRNMLTTGATARLLAEIVTGKAVSPERSKQMMDLLKRDFSGTSTDADDQAHGFTAIALNKLNLNGAKLWSKAGWTSKTRHDAAYIETPDGLKFVLVVFTENFANERDIIPNIAEKVLTKLADRKEADF